MNGAPPNCSVPGISFTPGLVPHAPGHHKPNHGDDRAESPEDGRIFLQCVGSEAVKPLDRCFSLIFCIHFVPFYELRSVLSLSGRSFASGPLGFWERGITCCRPPFLPAHLGPPCLRPARGFALVRRAGLARVGSLHRSHLPGLSPELAGKGIITSSEVPSHVAEDAHRLAWLHLERAIDAGKITLVRHVVHVHLCLEPATGVVQGQVQ